MKRTAALALAGLAFGGGALLAAPSASAAAAVSTCTYNYSVNYQWQGGFYAQLTIDYALTGTSAGWTAGFDFASSGQRVTSSWNANTTQSGNHVAMSSSGAQFLAPNGSLSLAFVGSYSTSNPAPTNVTFDGVSCSSYTWNV